MLSPSPNSNEAKALYRKIRNVLAGKKNPWDDIESSARLYRLRREQGGVQARDSNLGMSDLRSALVQKIRQNPPQEFGQVVQLIELITEKPVVLTPLHCSHCAASLQLPSSGEWTRCQHCGHDFHVANMVGLLERLLSG